MSAESYQLNPNQWVNTHADYLYTYAIKRINEVDLARDLVQETFLAALQNAGKFEGKSTERTWLTAILKNKIIDVYRKKSSGLNKEVQQAEDEQQDFFEADGHWSPGYRPVNFGIETGDPLLKKELGHILQMCIQKLPALWMAVFTMKHIDDEETSLICSQLKVSPSNFWVIIHRAKLNLRACLEKNW